jgi:antagonist of KipI
LKAFTVLKPGPRTTVQDTGRPGLRRYGIPTSGAIDQFSFHIANALVGNPSGAAALEITLVGLVVEAFSPVVVAVTGGDLGANWNNRPAPLWTTFTMEQGDRLSFQKRLSGCRAYLAVRGGIDAAEYLGSKSTFLKGGMGMPLKEGDTVSVGGFLPPSTGLRRMLPSHLRPSQPAQQTVRVILGPQTDYFTQQGIDTFLQSTYTVSPKSDRQGIRTEGPAIEIAKGPDIISDPTPLGAIQIPGDGKPIILHRDGQVTGGYAKIATVITADLNKFGQLMPGDPLRFQAVTRDVALSFAYQSRQQLNLLTAMITSQDG